jgi:hypothetical protein
MKVKICDHCGKELFCKACGQRVTPIKKPKEPKHLTATYLSDEELEEVKKKAKKAGVSVAEYIRTNLVK